MPYLMKLFKLMVHYFFQAESVCSQGSDLDKTAGNLLYIIATKLKSQIGHHRRFLAEYVGSKKILSEQQLTGRCLVFDHRFICLMLSECRTCHEVKLVSCINPNELRADMLRVKQSHHWIVCIL